MSRFYFSTAFDGSLIGTIDAPSLDKALNYWSIRTANSVPQHDVIVIHEHSVKAIIGYRGNRKADVMVLDYMRQRIIEANKRVA